MDLLYWTVLCPVEKTHGSLHVDNIKNTSTFVLCQIKSIQFYLYSASFNKKCLWACHRIPGPNSQQERGKPLGSWTYGVLGIFWVLSSCLSPRERGRLVMGRSWNSLQSVVDLRHLRPEATVLLLICRVVLDKCKLEVSCGFWFFSQVFPRP